jgi:ribonuclease HI
MTTDRATVYVAGHVDRASGVGGWGVVLETSGRRYEVSGRESVASKTRMELRAVIEAIERCTESVIEVRCSRYVADGPEFGDENLGLWEQIATLDDGSAQIIWTRASGKDDGMTRADSLTRRASRGEVVPFRPVQNAGVLTARPVFERLRGTATVS